MSKTLCSKCVFGAEVTAEKSCEFDIPNRIHNKNMLSVVDNYYAIDNYNCLYGFSKSQYDLNKENLQNIDLRQHAIDHAKLKYYLLVDVRKLSMEDLEVLVNSINNLDIKPQKVSIICNPNEPDKTYQYLRKNINCPRWTAHLFIEDLPLNDCINTVLDTNLTGCNAWCVLFYDASQRSYPKDLNSIVNELHEKIIINQETAMGVINTTDSLHCLCLNCSAYKFITTTISNDILKGLSVSKEDIILSNYEIP